MPYVFDNRNGDSITIADGSLNQDFSIDLVGRNYENYGEVFARSFVDLLDNFATDTTPPVNSIDGQLWYDKTYKTLRVFDGVNSVWLPTRPIISATNPTNFQGQNADGTFFYDTTTQQLNISHNGIYKLAVVPGEVNSGYNGIAALGSPLQYGTKLRTIFLTDDAGVQRAVMAVIYENSSTLSATKPGGETIIALFNDHAEFTADDVNSFSNDETINWYDQLNESGGIGLTIRKGLNLRADNKTRVEVANVADRANTSYALNVGSYGNDAGNISAGQVFYNAQHNLPLANATYDLGDTSLQFAEVFSQDFIVGNSITTGGADNVTIGEDANVIDHIYVNDITIKGDISTDGGDFGSEAEPIGNAYFGNVNVANVITTGTHGGDGYAFPTSDGARGQQLFTNGSGQLFFRRPASSLTNFVASGGTVSTETTTTVDGIDEITVTLDIGAGQGITVAPDEIIVDIDEFNTDDLAEGSTNLYHTTSRVRSAISADDTGGDGSFSYNQASGVFTYTGPSASEVRAHLSDGAGITYDNTTGVISFSKTVWLDSVNPGKGLKYSDTATSPVTDDGLSLTTTIIDVGGGYGITVNADNIEVSNADIRGLFSGGSDISVSSEGVITNDAPDQTVVLTGSGKVSVTGTYPSFAIAGAATTPNEIFGGITYSTGLSYNSSAQQLNFTGEVLGDLNVSGDICAFDTSVTSDRQFKDNIELIVNPVDTVKSLRGVTFDWNEQSGKSGHDVGVIAQEVEEILPEVVKTDEDTGVKSVAYHKLVPVLIEAVKSLSNEIEVLKKELGKE
jgi:hypothetical protein